MSASDDDRPSEMTGGAGAAASGMAERAAASPAPAAPRGGSLFLPTLIFGLYLVATAAGGVLLVVAFRTFSLTAGYAAAALFAAVAALAVGGAAGAVLLGQSAYRSIAPFAALALLQAALGLSALLSPLLFRAARVAYLLLWPLLGPTAGGSWGLRFGLALALLALPAAFFCAMPLALARLMVCRPEGIGLSIAFSFGLTLAGLGLGKGIAGSLIVPSLGLKGSLLMGVALASLAASGTVLVRQRGVDCPGALGAALSGGEIPAGDDSWSGTEASGGVITGGLLAATVVLFGFSAWSYLTIWDRTLNLLVGGTLQAGMTAAAVFLVGMALGSFLVAGVADSLRRPILFLAGILGAISVVAWLSMHLVPQASLLYLRLTPLLARTGLSQVPVIVTTAALALPACLLLGMALPLLPVVAGSRGRALAGTLAFLGIGALFAEASMQLVVVPAFGLRRSICLAAAVGLLSIVLLIRDAPFRKQGLRATVSLVVLAMMIVLGLFPASWDPRVVAAGLYRYGARSLERYGSAEQYLSARRGVDVVYYREGSDSCLSIERTMQESPGLPPSEALALTVDGKVEATTGLDIRTQVLQGQIPILVHGPTDTVLLADVLNGVTAGSILRHPIKSLTIVEREPAMFEAAERFDEYNHAPLADERVVKVVDTARARLLADESRYDVIILSTLEPWLPYGASIMTREGYALVRSRLRPGGIAAQRVQMAASGDTALRSILRTFAHSFESVLVMQISQEDLLLLGSADDLALDVGWLRNIIGSSAGVAEDLRRVLVLGPNELLLTFRLGGTALRDLMGREPLNDDDHNPVEFASARRLEVHQNYKILGDVEGAWAGIIPFLKNYGALPQERADFVYNLAKSYLGMAADPVRARELAQELSGLARPAMARWVNGECDLQMADIDGAIAEWRSVLDLDPSNLDALFSLGTYYLDSRDYWKAEEYLARAARLFPDTAVVRYHHGRNLHYLGRYKEAIDELLEARRVAAGKDLYPLVDYLVGTADQKLGKHKEAAEALQAYLKWAYTQNALTRLEVDAHLKLADSYDKLGKRYDAHKERQKGEELLRRIQAYARQQAARQQGSAPAPGAAATPDAATSPGAAPSPGAPSGTPGPGPVPPGSAGPSEGQRRPPSTVHP